MKRLTRDEFEALVTRKAPVAGLPDGSDVELTVNQAIQWFEQVESFSRPSLVLELDRWVFLGETDEHERERIYQVGGRQ